MCKIARITLGMCVLSSLFVGSIRISGELWLREYNSVKQTVEEQREIASDIERTALTDTIVEYNLKLDKIKLCDEYLPSLFFPRDIKSTERIN